MTVLTLTEQQTLRADLLSWTDPALVAMRDGPDPYSVLNWYNTIATPDWIIWKLRITREDLVNATTFAGAGGLIARSAGEQFAYRLIFDQSNINPSLVNIRQAFADIFSGTQQAAIDTRNALTAVSRRTATNLERVFSTGTGTTASPATTTMDRRLDPERDIRPLLVS